MPVAAVAPAALGAGASLLGANAAARASRRATDASLNLQRQQFDQIRADQQPYMNAGYGALEDLRGDLAAGSNWSFTPQQYVESPGFNYLLDRTLAQVQARAAAGGYRLSEATLQRMTDATRGMLSQDYYQQQGVSRANYESDRDWRTSGLTSLGGWGQAAAGQVGAAGQNYATQGGNALLAHGANQVAGARGVASDFNSLLGQGSAGIVDMFGKIGRPRPVTVS
jgi:hypothetical protein